MEEDEREFQHRGFDKKNTDFQSKEPGKVIKSLRKFGIEVEMYHSARKSLNELSKNVAKAFGLEHDGSIEAGGGYGVEVVSPILRGSAGENAVVGLFKTINKLGFQINRSCGFHVHLDGEGFGENEKFFISRVGELEDKKVSDTPEDSYAFVVADDVMSKLMKLTGWEADDVARVIADEHLTSGDSLYLSKEIGHSIPEIRRQSAIMEVGNTKSMVDMFVFPSDNGDSMKVTVDKSAPGNKDYFCTLYGRRNLRNILTLMYLHTVYSDVLMSMLPKSRRQDNLYCQPLSLAFSAQKIESIQTFAELEKEWYNTRTVQEAQRHKGNNYDDSRYFTMNLHSLFAKYGTIEIRSHGATLDHNKALYWAAFHQEILDAIVEGRLTIEQLRYGAHTADLEEKTTYLMSVLGLRPALLKYMRQRIDYFKSKNK